MWTKFSTYHHDEHIVEEILERLHQLHGYLSELLDINPWKYGISEINYIVWRLRENPAEKNVERTSVNSIFDRGVSAPQLFLLASLKCTLIHLIASFKC